MKTKFLPSCAALALSLAALGAQAAVTYSQGVVHVETDILNIGQIIEANSIGGLRQANTVNGIHFGTSEAAVGGMGDSGGDFSAQFGNGTPLDKLFSSLMFQTGGNSSLTFSGLTVGESYLLQLLLDNNINSTGKASAISFQNSSYNIANFGNDADYIRIGFVADAATQTLTFGTGSGNEAERMVLNAYVLSHETPLPGTLPLLGIAGAALAWRRKKVC